MVDKIEELLNMDNETTRSNYCSWDKGDCSKVGIVRLLLIQTIQEEILERDIYYDGCYDDILYSLENEFDEEASWNYQHGVLLSYVDAKILLDELKKNNEDFL